MKSLKIALFSLIGIIIIVAGIMIIEPENNEIEKTTDIEETNDISEKRLVDTTSLSLFDKKIRYIETAYPDSDGNDLSLIHI